MTADDIKKHIQTLVHSDDALKRELAATLLYGALKRREEVIAILRERIELFEESFGELPVDPPSFDVLDGGK